jgi:membrane protease YdiL (CAAX protease family)
VVILKENKDLLFFILDIFLILIPLVLSLKEKGNLKAALKFLYLDFKDKWRILYYSLLGLSFLFVGYILLNLVAFSFNLYDYNVENKIRSFSLPVIILGFTLAPIAEEIFFRGYLFHKLFLLSYSKIKKSNLTKIKEFYSFVFAAIIVSFVFSIFHLGYGSALELIFAFFASFLFCFLTFKSSSLYPAILSHILINFISFCIVICSA